MKLAYFLDILFVMLLDLLRIRVTITPAADIGNPTAIRLLPEGVSTDIETVPPA